MRGFILILGIVALNPAHSAPLAPPETTRQAIVVAVENWQSVDGVLRCFRRDDASTEWSPIGPAIPVVVGRNGMAWGLGLHAVPGAGPRKKEGDGKAPAGIFTLPGAFGAEPKPEGLRLPYQQASPTLVGVDDPRSRFYNRIVDRATIAEPDWRSAEDMLRKDDLYALGIVVGHNPAPIPGAGSCIFLHVWRGMGRGTAGCTAMEKDALIGLQRWLIPERNPVLIQGPREFIPAALLPGAVR